jgi:hypothetical protein|tara:strand:- start:54708 stop:55325 length:618 start_codon:yes stop_codon:yes gene_type:complete
MTIADAYDYLDLMLDKADQPFYTNNEKDIFINLSITEFLNERYALMRANQDYSEMTGARESASETSSNVTVAANYCEFNTSYHHLTYANVNGVECRIVSDDELAALRTSNNPFKEVNAFNPICATTTTVAGDTRLYFHFSPAGGVTPDFTSGDTFGLRYLKHLNVSDWDDIPEQYQHDILNVVVRKMTANIESTNYTVQAHEAQQ